MAKVIRITTTREINGRSISAEPDSVLVLAALGDSCTVDSFAVRVSIPTNSNGCRPRYPIAADRASKEGKAGKSGVGAEGESVDAAATK
jgi:hypothetical protein